MNVVLSIAGSDSSGGAGIQADLKTFEAFGVFGCSVITVLTAQNTTGVNAISKIEPEFIKAQIEAVMNDFDVKAIKIGMLFSNEVIDVIKAFLHTVEDIPVVLDPVCISKSNVKLLSDDAIENLKTLFSYSTIITPNLYEAKVLFPDGFDMDKMSKFHECAVVIKNQKLHINGHDRSVDILYEKGKTVQFDTPYLQSSHTHGTGCSFSSAIAANLALGKELKEAIALSKKFIYLGIKNAPHLGHGKGPIAHKKAAEICFVKVKSESNS